MGSLCACADVAMTGAQVVYNRHNIQKQVNDQWISTQAYQALNLNRDEFQNANISIATFNQEVLLAGQVPHFKERKLAEEMIRKIPGILHVYNRIEVKGPSSSLSRINDAWITAKVKSKLIASEVDPAAIKVVTENSVVYLMGTVKPKDAEIATHIASTTDGVGKVVKIFSYLIIKKHLGAALYPV